MATDRAVGRGLSSNSFSCLECGKRFLSEANLRQHRRSRHLLPLKSVERERLDELRETNSRIQLQLQQLQNANASKNRSCSATSASSSNSGEVSPEPESATRELAAAVPSGKIAELSVAQLAGLRNHPFRLGTTLSELLCVGLVEDDVVMGYLDSADGQGVPGVGPTLEILQFTLRLEGYRQRRVSLLKMYRNCLLVRVVNPQWKIQRGDVLLIGGTYGLHKSYDVVSKQAVGNAILETGYVGLLHRGNE